MVAIFNCYCFHASCIRAAMLCLLLHLRPSFHFSAIPPPPLGLIWHLHSHKNHSLYVYVPFPSCLSFFLLFFSTDTHKQQQCRIAPNIPLHTHTHSHTGTVLASLSYKQTMASPRPSPRHPHHHTHHGSGGGSGLWGPHNVSPTISRSPLCTTIIITFIYIHTHTYIHTDHLPHRRLHCPPPDGPNLLQPLCQKLGGAIAAAAAASPSGGGTRSRGTLDNIYTRNHTHTYSQLLQQ
jgi:hypothetical protein